MKRKAFTLVEAIVVIVILAIIAAILFPVFARKRDGRRSRCMSNLKQIALGVKQYVQDYDEKFPPAQNATGGWAELVFPYVKSEQIFQCPSNRSLVPKKSDYFYNSRLSGVEEGKLEAISITILMGDGAFNNPLSSNLSQLPNAWRTDPKPPASRHLDGAYYAFADGHVKWLKPQNITLDKPAKNNPTFLLGSIRP